MGRDVILSYDHDDGAHADRVYGQLRVVGLPVWKDHEIAPGAVWEPELTARLEGCAALVVVMTPRSAASAWVRREIDTVARAGGLLLPVLVEGAAWAPLDRIQYDDVRDGRPPSPAFVSRLRAAVGQADAPPGLRVVCGKIRFMVGTLTLEVDGVRWDEAAAGRGLDVRVPVGPGRHVVGVRLGAGRVGPDVRCDVDVHAGTTTVVTLRYERTGRGGFGPPAISVE